MESKIYVVICYRVCDCGGLCSHDVVDDVFTFSTKEAAQKNFDKIQNEIDYRDSDDQVILRECNLFTRN